MGERRRRRRIVRGAAASLIGGWLLVSADGARRAQAGILQATYLGGRGQTDARALAIDPTSGDIILAGASTFADIPGTAAGAQPDHAGVQDAWVARLSPDLRTLEQATYLGGSSAEQGDAVAIDPATGDVLVAGFTESSDFPGTAGGVQPQLAGPSDVFVARLSADLKTLRQATYLGGSAEESEALLGIAIDRNSGNVVVVGTTSSNDFPGTAGGAQPAGDGKHLGDGFAARLSGDLKTLIRATYVGGAGQDRVYDVVIHPSTHDVLVAGDSTPTSLSRRFGVVTCLSGDLAYVKGVAKVASGGANTTVWGLAIDPVFGDVIAAGETEGPLERTGNGAQRTFGGGSSDAFAARFTADLGLLQATYLGGSGDDGGITKPAVRPDTGEVFVTGRTQSSDFPATHGGAQAALNGTVQDAFVARLSADLTTLEQVTYLGGSQGDSSYQIAVKTDGSEVIVAGDTSSTDLPATAGGAQPIFEGPAEDPNPYAAFAVRIDATLTAAGPTPTAVPPTPTAPTAVTPTATTAPTSTEDCAGDCRGNGQVTIDDLITGVDIALGNAPMSICAVFDVNGDSRVTIDELIRAVTNALTGCG